MEKVDPKWSMKITMYIVVVFTVVMGIFVVKILTQKCSCPQNDYNSISAQISGMQQSIEMQNADNLMTMETYFNDCNNHPEEGN